MPDQTQTDDKASSGAQPPIAPVPPEAKVPHAEAVTPKGDDTQKPPQSDLDRAMVNWTRLVAIFTAVLAIIAGLQGWIIWGQLAEMRATREGGDKSTADQLNVMLGQLNQMNLAQRPWIKLERVEPTSLTSDDVDGVMLWAKVVVSNVGHSPAQNVSVTADLLIRDFDLPSNEGMNAACQKGNTGSWIIPGRPIFPGQTQAIDGDASTSWFIDIQRIRNARFARISNIYSNRAAKGDTYRARAWANETAKFPFFAPVSLVGCINYRSPDNKQLYQTSFMFDLEADNGAAPLPLLSGQTPVDQPPTPNPSDPEVLEVHPRKLQRILSGSQIKLTVPLYGTFAN